MIIATPFIYLFLWAFASFRSRSLAFVSHSQPRAPLVLVIYSAIGCQ